MSEARVAPSARVIVNSIPHCGTHLVTAILDLLGMRHSHFSGVFLRSPSLRGAWEASGGWRTKVKRLLPIERRRDRPVVLHWRTSLHVGNLFAGWRGSSLPVSVGSPRPVRTALVRRLLAAVEQGEYVVGHVPYTKSATDLCGGPEWRGILVIRDPRDMAFSALNHIRHHPEHVAFDYLFRRLTTDADRLEAIVEGFDKPVRRRGLVGVVKMYESMLPWTSAHNVTTVKFESLVGVRGGGDSALQGAAVRRLLTHVGVTATEQLVDYLCDACFGRGQTFRRGQIGSWRERIGDADADRITTRLSDLLRTLGYQAGELRPTNDLR